MKKSVAALAILLPVSWEPAQPTQDGIQKQDFDRLRALIRPQEGESLWRHIPWETSLHEARRKAAEAGKPLLIWAGGGSAPLGGC